MFVLFWRSPDGEPDEGDASSGSHSSLPGGLRYEPTGDDGETTLLVPCEVMAVVESGKGGSKDCYYTIQCNGLGKNGAPLNRLILLDTKIPNHVYFYQWVAGPGSLPVALSEEAQAFVWEGDGRRWARAANLLEANGFL